VDYTLPSWAKSYIAAMEKSLGKAYAEPAGDVRGYIAYVKSQRNKVGCTILGKRWPPVTRLFAMGEQDRNACMPPDVGCVKSSYPLRQVLVPRSR